ncbi:hypothetical protein Cgig2_032079 [Carnegiea gigantea]|uniref:MYND-type domain-containing protein n=1 Tax=Carnegiea gigantea TaxID=171969 RepID=A0A9Q1JZA6_9CARY|nr:hypothetical protein Cgig2_032079 [Carnegiea gigantea]
MERLKAMIPVKIRRMIDESTSDDLPATASTLHDFFAQSPAFRSMIDDLTSPQRRLCAKNKESALQLKEKGNAYFSKGDYSKAVQSYTTALRVAPLDAVDKGVKLVATLYVNRASCLHKLSLLEESLRDCSRALALSPRYVKNLKVSIWTTSMIKYNWTAWYRRGKVNTSLSNYEDAICDLKVAMDMEETCSGKKQMETDLKLVLDQNKTGNSVQMFGGNKHCIDDEEPHAELRCASSPTTGRGMTSQCDIAPSSLVHREEPYAAIILKTFRETHCHFCFNELPADSVPCPSCSIPLYCSDNCQLQAGGPVARIYLRDKQTTDMPPGELEQYFSEVTLGSVSHSGVDCFAEHRHECCGSNWASVLPSEAVLAGRIFVKLVELKEHSWNRENIKKSLDLCHAYAQLPLESKIELHVYSIVLLYCLHHSFASDLELNGATIAKVIILMSQIKLNCMAIVRVRYGDIYNPLNQSRTSSLPGDPITSNLEQVRVGQALYLTGSLFNHSCLPNVHSYFASRTLFMRSIEFVASGSPLEMSYGPQLGQCDYGIRQGFLQKTYSFECQCIGCTRVNFPDLVLRAFRCVQPNCFGVVLDQYTLEHEKHKVEELKNDEIKKLAPLIFEESNYPLENHSVCCLKCGSIYDLKPLRGAVDDAEIHLMKYGLNKLEVVASNRVNSDAISKALGSLDVFKSALHPYNKKLAAAEDILAEAYCSAGQLQQAISHCMVSIEILKKIFYSGHIALGNELVKLSSIQLALGDPAAADTIHEIDAIFSKHYGKHAEVLFPYLQHLKREAHRLVDGE